MSGQSMAIPLLNGGAPVDAFNRLKQKSADSEVDNEEMMSSSQSDATDAVTSDMTSQPATASSSAGSRQTPSPSTPPPPMTSQEDNPQSRGQAASGEERRKGGREMEGSLLGNHPETHLVCGSTAEVIAEWVRSLQHLRATASHAFKGSTVEERVESFKKACIRRCSIAGLSPGQSVKASADLHHRFLLTEEQLRVQDSQAELLHISGPYGSGKTLLLAERARCWLREGRRVALAVGVLFQNVLLHHLMESICCEKTDVARVSTHRDDSDLLKWLDTVSTEDPVSIIVDEAWFSSTDVSYSRLLDHVTADRVRRLWTGCTAPLSDWDVRKLQSLGGSTVQLCVCLRCPPHVMAWTHTLRGDRHPPLLPPPIPVMRELVVGVEVISHADHHHSQSWRMCPRCREEVTAFFSSLGYLKGQAMSALKLNDVVVITNDPWCDREEVVRWLQDLGLHAVAEKRDIWRYGTRVLPPGVAITSPVQEEQEAARRRVLKGKDVTGSPAVQVVGCYDFQGLERPLVVL